jgi:D-lactate dehydrogenase
MQATKAALGLAALVSRTAGPGTTAALAGAARKLTGVVPKIGRALPTPAAFNPMPAAGNAGAVVYFPACLSRTMGPAVGDPETESLPTVVARLLVRAGYGVVYPERLNGLCCGQPFESKGLQITADAKAAELEDALRKASDNGRLPIVMDASTCTWRMRSFLCDRLRIVDSIEFLHDSVLPRLKPRQQAEPVLIHLNCGAFKMGLGDKMVGLARACAAVAVVPDGVACCGFAGDKGFTTPQLNDHALRQLARQVPAGCEAGYSSNRTCEIGLADHAGVPYRNIAYLLDRTTR